LITALNGGTADAVAATLTGINDSIAHLIDVREQIGYRWESLDDTRDVLEAVHQRASLAFEDEVGADPLETYTRLAALRSNYEAALQVTASTQKPKLFDFIG
jgi:flagellin-like hook-associated protein FlgL